jgi:hypothetical protein
MSTQFTAGFLATLFLGAITLSGHAQSEPPKGGGPPPLAYSACSGKSKGDACSVKLGEREMKGTCENPPPDAEDTRLACRPSDMPRR